MLSAILLLLISVDAPSVAESGRYPEATEIFRCLFDEAADRNFDTWPDGWTRERGIGYPAYVKIAIQRESSPGGENCLCVNVDGGGAIAYSPPIPIGIDHGYVLETYIRTEGLKNDAAYLTLTFLDAENHTVATMQSRSIPGTQGWQKVRLGTFETANPDVRWLKVGLHVEPQGDPDLHGKVYFSDVWVGRLARMELKTNHPHNFFLLPVKPKVTCTVMGKDERLTEATFELFDVFGESLAKETRPLAVLEQPAKKGRSGEKESSSSNAIHEAEWEPPLSGQGFYRIRMHLKGSVPTGDFREITLVSLEPGSPSGKGMFGWSLPQGPRPIDLDDLVEILSQSGLGWVKYPVWCSEEDGGVQREKILAFADKLIDREIEFVGLLTAPPESIRNRFPAADPLSAADVFGEDPKKWFPSLEPLIIQASNRMRCWQLGLDTDQSLMNLPNCGDRIGEIRKQLDEAMAGMRLSIGWDWSRPLPARPASKKYPWDIGAMTSTPPLTDRELGERLDADRASPITPWVVLTPLSRDDFPLEERAADLVKRMMTAKIHGAEAVFCPDPFDPKTGLMNPDGTPGELFMPWRSVALQIGDGQYVGGLTLPNRSPNYVFIREKDAAMFLYNTRRTEESLYFGANAKRTDMWGRTYPVLETGGSQMVFADTRPLLVTGMNKAIAQWSIGLVLAKPAIPNEFGKSISNGFRVKNYFSKGITGRVVLVTPELWTLDRNEIEFQVAPNETLEGKFSIMLPSLVANGRNNVRFDFDIQAERRYVFSVYRNIDVGSNAVRIEMKTRLNNDDVLEVEQRFINETDKKVSYRCDLNVPGRTRMSKLILDMGRGEQIQIYRLKNGRSLIGQELWLHAEQADGDEMLNYRFPAEK
jgi:hypothetical protein